MGGWGGWRAVGGLKQKYSSTNGSAVPLVGDPDLHNSQGRLGHVL